MGRAEEHEAASLCPRRCLGPSAPRGTALSGPFCTTGDVTDSFLPHLHKGGGSLPLKGGLLSARRTEAETGEPGTLPSFQL